MLHFTSLQSNDPIPSTYSLSLQSLDGLEDMDHVETTATIEPSVLTLEVVSGLPFRRLWNCTVLAYGCQENNIVNDELSEFYSRYPASLATYRSA